MNKIIPIRADPDLVSQTVQAVHDRIVARRQGRSNGPIGVTAREATVLTASMNDMNMGGNRGMAFEPEIGDEGTVFGQPFIVIPEP